MDTTNPATERFPVDMGESERAALIQQLAARALEIERETRSEYSDAREDMLATLKVAGPHSPAFTAEAHLAVRDWFADDVRNDGVIFDKPWPALLEALYAHCEGFGLTLMDGRWLDAAPLGTGGGLRAS
jgi:hypothetical protein